MNSRWTTYSPSRQTADSILSLANSFTDYIIPVDRVKRESYWTCVHPNARATSGNGGTKEALASGAVNEAVQIKACSGLLIRKHSAPCGLLILINPRNQHV